MNALFGKQDSDVEYSSDASILDTNIDELTVHHESLTLMKTHEIISQVGGSASGELILHDDGQSLDNSLFEESSQEDTYV